MSEADPSIKLVKLTQPEPSTHPDELMGWTLEDVRRLFPTGDDKASHPLKLSKA